MGYLLAALLSGFLLFNGAATPHKVASVAQSALQKQYPSGHVAVEIEGKRGADVLKGRFRRVHVSLADLSLADLPFSPSQNARKIGKAGQIEVDLRHVQWGNLPIEAARFDFRQVDYDFEALRKRSQFQIVRMGPSQMQLQISGASLQPLFAARLQDIENPVIHLEGNALHLSGSRAVLGNATPIELTAALVGAGNEVRLSNPQIKVGGVQLPAIASAALTKDVGALYAFDRNGRWPFGVEVQSVSAQNEILTIETNLTLKAQPAEIETK